MTTAGTSGAAGARILRGSVVIAVAMAVMNLTTYGFTIFAARLLGPVEYGALAAVMGLLLVLNVLSLGLQATGARRVAASPEDRSALQVAIMRTTYRSAAGLGLLCLLAVPAISGVLNLDSWTVAALIAVTVVPLTVMGGQAGVLQGARRWAPLAGIYLAVGVGRIVFGTVALVVEPSTLAAMLGVSAGAFVPAVVGWWALRRGPVSEPSGSSGDPGAPAGSTGRLLAETVRNSHALLAFFALSNIDVVVARSVLDERQAGLYAGGLILTKAVLFLPQFVVVIVFPAMSSTGSARRINLLALGLVLAIGSATVAGTALLSGLAVVFIGGPAYDAIQTWLWLFAALGTLLAMLQLMVYNVVARQRQRRVLVLWAGLVAILAAGATAGDVSTLVVTVLAIDALVFAVLLLRAGTRSRGRLAADEVSVPPRASWARSRPRRPGAR
ncbi:MAG: lipopolysaccharide biosynthesis protein [Actinomycetes bacterium]